MTSQTSFPTAKGKDGSKRHADSGLSGLLAGGAGNDHAERTPSTREWQGELHGTFCTEASRGKQRSRSATLSIWLVSPHRSLM